MSTLYKVNTANSPALYFNKPDGTLGMTLVAQIAMGNLVVGEKLIISAQTTVSCLANPSIPYVGWPHNTFTASQIYFRSTPSTHWFSPAGSIPLGPQSGEDIHDGAVGDEMSPYYNHDQTAMHEIVAGQTGTQWVIFVAWASCSLATGDSVAKNEYLYIIPQQTTLQILRLPS